MRNISLKFDINKIRYNNDNNWYFIETKETDNVVCEESY